MPATTPDFTPHSSIITDSDGRRQLVVTINLADTVDNMRQHELLTRDLTNHIGRHLMEHALQTADTDGEPLKVGKVLHTSKGNIWVAGESGFSPFSTKDGWRGWFTRITDSSKEVYLYSNGDGGPIRNYGDRRPLYIIEPIFQIAPYIFP
jgi:hypothetical protein